jgi:hypothetical protein
MKQEIGMPPCEAKRKASRRTCSAGSNGHSSIVWHRLQRLRAIRPVEIARVISTFCDLHYDTPACGPLKPRVLYLNVLNFVCGIESRQHEERIGGQTVLKKTTRTLFSLSLHSCASITRVQEVRTSLTDMETHRI